MTLILLNGPPRSGKDTLAGLLCGKLQYEGISHWKLSTALKVRTHAMYGLVDTNGRTLAANYYEAVKDDPSDRFLGLTPRQAYIEAHERYWKPVHGPRILGQLLVEHVKRWSGGIDKHIVVSDAGDAEQCIPLVEMAGAENTVLVHLDRPGCSWDNRVRFTLPDVRTVPLDNSCSLADLHTKIPPILSRESPFPADTSSGS